MVISNFVADSWYRYWAILLVLGLLGFRYFIKRFSVTIQEQGERPVATNFAGEPIGRGHRYLDGLLLCFTIIVVAVLSMAFH